jgi:hypothetical protein
MINCSMLIFTVLTEIFAKDFDMSSRSFVTSIDEMFQASSTRPTLSRIPKKMKITIERADT